MIRKHTRRAAKAAFAISFGVAIILGGATTAGARSEATQTPIIVGRLHKRRRIAWPSTGATGGSR